LSGYCDDLAGRAGSAVAGITARRTDS